MGEKPSPRGNMSKIYLIFDRLEGHPKWDAPPYLIQVMAYHKILPQQVP